MCCVALPCCLFDLACFFLPSFSSLIKTLYIHVFYQKNGSSVGRALCLECRVSWVRVPPEAAQRKVIALGVLCCFALFVACFFLPSFSSPIKTYVHTYVSTYTFFLFCLLCMLVHIPCTDSNICGNYAKVASYILCPCPWQSILYEFLYFITP